MLTRWAARHFRQCVAFLVQWAENAGKVGRFPRTCQAIWNVWEAYCQEKGLNNPHAPQPAVVLGERRNKNLFHLTSCTLAHNSELDIVKRHRADAADRKWRSRQKKRIQQLEDQLRTLREKHETSKTVGGILSVEWIVRVILASANTSSRALQQTFTEAVGSDSSRVSRESIGKIKAAFAEVWKSMHVTILTQVFSMQHSPVEAAHRDGPARGGPLPARGGPGPARGGPGPAGGGPPRAFEGEGPQLFAWGRLADELLWRSHRRSFLCWLRLALQHLIWSTQRTALQEMLNLQFQ